MRGVIWRAAIVLAVAVLLGPVATPSEAARDAGPVGYGRLATGGVNGPAGLVTSTADAGPGTLRDLLARGDRRISFGTSGRITLRTPLLIPSNVTIDGVGADITIAGNGFVLDGVRNVVLRRLRFTDGVGANVDAVRLVNGARDIWIDHLSLSRYPDGLIDITRGATDVTVSWSRFTDQDKVMLINTDRDPGVPVRVTLHNNLFDGTRQRNPVVRYATVHAYNNVVRGWRLYGMRATRGGELRSEGNVFLPGAKRSAIEASGDLGPGRVRSDGDVVVDGARIETREPELVFDPRLDYGVRVAKVDLALIGAVLAGAGA